MFAFISGPKRRHVSLAICTFILAACSSGQPAVETPAPAPAPAPSPTPAQAPWTSARLPVTTVPTAYTTAWRQAENRATCALIAFADSEATRGAVARTATFAGGWGVAYDQPELRSAFGVAGAGVKASDPTYDEWPFKRSWPDGSTVGYGPEGGGAGPNQLAYLRIAGQGCLYNVWSRVSRSHLEQLLESIRFVQSSSN